MYIRGCWWFFTFFNRDLKNGLQDLRIHWCASNSRSSQARVTSVKSFSSLSSPNEDMIFASKSFHLKLIFSSMTNWTGGAEVWHLHWNINCKLLPVQTPYVTNFDNHILPMQLKFPSSALQCWMDNMAKMQLELPSSSSKLLRTQRAANLAIRHLLPTAVGVSGSNQMIGLTSWSEDDAGDQLSR